MLEGLGLTHAQFIDLCILMGCDYTSNIRGIGPKSALTLIKKYGDIEHVLENISKVQSLSSSPGLEFLPISGFS